MTKLYLDLEDIESRPNDMELGGYVRTQYWNKKESVMSKEKDYVAKIMDEWYSLMSSNNVSVQPKASTLLGTILAKYDIQLKEDTRDIWDEYLTITGGQFKGWYDSLTEEQQNKWHADLKTSRRTNSDLVDTKALLKG